MFEDEILIWPEDVMGFSGNCRQPFGKANVTPGKWRPTHQILGCKCGKIPPHNLKPCVILQFLRFEVMSRYFLDTFSPISGRFYFAFPYGFLFGYVRNFLKLLTPFLFFNG
jgi:hypothetical protein